ncbi:MAG: FAD-binding oxidoreductase [Hyphomicrobiaceae bacterium]|nr:FAD-binding oxidoreductase [Hyphomicrobiaceae bacterium]
MTQHLRPPALAAPAPELIDRLAAIVGPEHALTDPDQQLPYLREWRDLFFGRTPLVLRPGSTEEVSRILALANEARVGVVPQAGNTGLVGGQTPFGTGTEIVLSVSRLKQVRDIDPAAYCMTVEAGLTLAECRAAAERADRLLPLSLPSEGSCRIGGNLATNAGGVGVLAYGNARQLALGLEVVLADGRVIPGLKALKKDNTGYDLKDLFIGSEGTLGIITAAVLKLFPRPVETATAMVALSEIAQALDLFSLSQETAGRSVTAFEFIPRICVEFVTRHVAGTREPFAKAYPWYVLIEISGAKPDGQAAREMEDVLGQAAERGLLLDAVLASSLAQARDLWRLRESISEAQKPEGGNIKHDVSVPIARIAEFIARADRIVESICPGARPLPLGHFGDGNVHYNVAQPVGMDKQRFMELWEPITGAVHALAAEMDGSISAEHGIGRVKRADLERHKSPVELDLMRRIKAAFDPNGILNPGKVLS